MHISHKKKQGITGTPRYCSLNAMQFMEQSRKDDIEAIGMILIYFFKGGKLPWMDSEVLATDESINFGPNGPTKTEYYRNQREERK